MAIVKSIPVKKFINGEILEISEHTLVNDPSYTTSGEYTVVIDDSIDYSEIFLDHQTTTHIVIKALTNVKIIPIKGKIDRDWDDILIGKGACVELKYILHNWYIISSDGLKIS